MYVTTPWKNSPMSLICEFKLVGFATIHSLQSRAFSVTQDASVLPAMLSASNEVVLLHREGNNI